MAPKQIEPFSLRLARDERLMLKGLAAQKGVSQSDVLRMLLREAYAQAQQQKPKPKK